MSEQTPEEPEKGAPEPTPTPDSGTVLPSGARVDANVDLDAPKGVSRRTLIGGTVGGVAVLAAAGFGIPAFVRSRDDKTTSASGLTVTKSWADKEIRITSPSGFCEAPLIVAYEKGLFKKAGLNVTLKKTGDDENVVEAVGSGKYTASNGIFFNYLGPIYNGTPVKLSGGLHHGCLSLVTRDDGSVPTVASLKGRKIGVSDLQGSATNFFSLDLLDAGINSSPEAKEVEWVVIQADLLTKALKDKKVDAIATAADPLAVKAVNEGWAKEISNNVTLSKNRKQPCCAVVLNDDFVSQDPVTAAKLVSVWAEGSRWAGAHLEETAKISSEKKYVAATAAEILPQLRTLTFDPSPKNLRAALEPGIVKYKKTGFLPADVDPHKLADQTFVDLGLNF